MSVTGREMCVKVKERYFKTKHRHAGILLNVNAIIYFIFELQLKFRDKDNCSSITANFHTALC
jgi:Na+-transporting NADH:ubiquinone oxidoreductase subunit NqrF